MTLLAVRIFVVTSLAVVCAPDNQDQHAMTVIAFMKDTCANIVIANGPYTCYT